MCTLSKMAAKEGMKFSNAKKITYFGHIKMPLTSIISFYFFKVNREEVKFRGAPCNPQNYL